MHLLGRKKKICPTYFKIGRTYFKLSQTYFQGRLKGYENRRLPCRQIRIANRPFALCDEKNAARRGRFPDAPFRSPAVGIFCYLPCVGIWNVLYSIMLLPSWNARLNVAYPSFMRGETAMAAV